MKNYILTIFCLFLLFGCQEEKPDRFTDTRFIQFKLGETPGEEYYLFDFSFAFASDETESKVMAIPVIFKGHDIGKNEKLFFAVEVDKEHTTLPEDCFLLDREQAFRPESGYVDTMHVTLLRKAILKEESKMLRLRLVSNRDFETDIPYSLFVDIRVGDIFTRPEWWDQTVVKSYLGEFSKMKYDEFMKETGAYDFGALDPSEKRYYAIMFKRALEKKPRLDENGSEMSVTVTG